MMKSVKYYDSLALGDYLETKLDWKNTVMVSIINESDLSIKQATCSLSPSDAISLGKKLIEFGQEQIDNRESK